MQSVRLLLMQPNLINHSTPVLFFYIKTGPFPSFFPLFFVLNFQSCMACPSTFPPSQLRAHFCMYVSICLAVGWPVSAHLCCTSVKLLSWAQSTPRDCFIHRCSRVYPPQQSPLKVMGYRVRPKTCCLNQKRTSVGLLVACRCGLSY